MESVWQLFSRALAKGNKKLVDTQAAIAWPFARNYGLSLLGHISFAKYIQILSRSARLFDAPAFKAASVSISKRTFASFIVARKGFVIVCSGMKDLSSTLEVTDCTRRNVFYHEERGTRVRCGSG